MRMCINLLVLVLFGKLSYVYTCPTECSCSTHSSGTYFYCWGKNLGVIPTNIPNNTYSMNLGYNGIIALEIQICKLFPELSTLLLRGNRISELPREFVEGCDNLRTLDLYGNAIYMVEQEALMNIPSLISLDLEHNNIRELNVSFCQHLPDLTTLKLNWNEIQEIPQDYLIECRQLRYLSLGRQLTHIDEFTFVNMSRLSTLNLESNSIQSIHKNAFSSLTSLTALDLSGNPLSANGYGFLNSCPYLTNLDLQNTRKESDHEFMKTNDLKNTPNIQILYIQSNLLSNIDEELYASMPKLQYLNIQSNRLVVLNESLCKLCPELTTLYVRYNQISEISSDFFLDCLKLQYLYFDSNQLLEIPQFFSNTNFLLRSLSFYNNKLTRIEQFTFANTTNLNQLKLHSNAISVIHPEAFSSLTSLQYLYLSSNPLSVNGYSFLKPLRNMHYLQLDSTRVGEVHPRLTKEDVGLMNNLQYLYYSNNMLTDLDPEFLDQVSNLNTLYMTNNKLSIIKANSFRNMNNLYRLHLQNNDISLVEKDAFGDNLNLRYLYLSGNPLHCNCSIVPFWTWLTARENLQGLSAVCSNGTILNKIPPQEFYHCNTSIPVVEADLIQGEILITSIPLYNNSPSLTPVFRCRSGDVLNGTYLFDVFWYINGNTVVQHENVSFENINSTLLREVDWINTYNLNMEVQCAIRMRSVEDYSPGAFIYSRIYHAGLVPEKLEYTVLEGESINVTFIPTVPVGCISSHEDFESHCDENFYIFQPNYDKDESTCNNGVSNRNVLFEEALCGIRLTLKTWRENKTLTVYGFNDGIYNYKGRTTYIRLGKISSNSYSQIWTNVSIPDVKLTIVDKDTLLVNRLCQIHNDPHVRTFDGQNYDYMEVGEYTMYRNDKGPYMVNVLFTTCGAGLSGPSCNCGVAIRSRNSLFVFRTCKTISKSGIHDLQQPVIRHYTCDENDMFIEQSKNSYKIRLPHGTEIKFSKYRWSRFVSGISIKPSVFDLDESRGLCGVPNTYKNPSDDYTHRQHGVVHDSKSFGDSWRITPDMIADQLFVENPAFHVIGDGLINEKNSTIKHYCACEQEAPRTGRIDEFYTLHCNLTDTTEYCTNSDGESENTLNPFYTSCTDLLVSRRRRSLYSSHRINRRSTSDSDDIVDFHPLTYDADAFTDSTEDAPTFRNDWTYEKAYNMCSVSIENKIPTDLYQEIVEVPLDYFISTCIKDIELTAETTYLEDTIGAITTFLVTELVRNESLYNQTTTDGDKTVLDYITSQLCPNNCSGHGNCLAGVCSCVAGYVGDQCSQAISTPPLHISIPSGGLCTLGNRTCRKTNIFGDFESSTVWSRLKHFEIFKTGIVYTSKDTKTLAQYRNMFMVTVTLPPARKKRSTSANVMAEGYDISLSNDGENFGDSEKLIIFNETCYSCDSLSVGCVDLGMCNGEDGSINPDPSQETKTKFTVTGIVAGATSAVVVILVVGIVCCYKCKTKDNRTKINVYNDQSMVDIPPTVQQWTSKKFWMTRENTLSELQLDLPDLPKNQLAPES